MKSSEKQILVLFSAIAGMNSNIECPKTLFVKNGEYTFEAPLIKIQGNFNRSLASVFTYMVSPYFQNKSGPLQPKDEQAFFDMRMECEKLIDQISEVIENTISQVQERKQKENLTERPI